ncbi:hypothetical protein BHU72_01385 [Desulfuribacillus stibiiarsenatis]|uniref:LysM domain-containing protein n=2 Tax=Desulfuribacillus stibiiarsenatis TaxID=1390249 RepID=A0A1E5LAA8_9FIRM|nr:hypothetical protein BHU72_01385 [Desulfuribacillus stibiiarsenatis]
MKSPAPAPTPAPSPAPQVTTYTVVSGDTLWLIASRNKITVDALMKANQLTSTTLQIGQVLVIPNTAQEIPRVTYGTYTVKQGDNSWNIAINHGMPFQEFLTLNKFTDKTMLSIGQVVQIAIYNIPVQNPVRTDRGAYLDWWTEVQYVFPIGAVAKVTDLYTGLTWNVKRTIGAFHADSEPLTLADTRIMQQAWGGVWSWTPRPILVEVNGHRIAASASSMPHSIQAIIDNGFEGHFDIHFANSIRHVDGLVDAQHQKAINIAAGK